MENVSWFERQVNWFSFYRYGAMANMLIFLSCYGSIAAVLSIKSGFTLGMIIAATTSMASNTALISQSPAKYCVGIFLAGFVIQTIIIIATFFM